ncbi:polysaccharide lyase family 7 protein [Uliginosibacterium sp. H3]|uniref:Polysaccharide lyase family 7 protein n=1 Tax=Uliginosibacterium silvisoli TaxID=3114758 RepID=A0ABU6JY31_9RHOO|nr:polysaccharide lyase family 7 protein [Uliginosibacterium sp. H3]
MRQFRFARRFKRYGVTFLLAALHLSAASAVSAEPLPADLAQLDHLHAWRLTLPVPSRKGRAWADEIGFPELARFTAPPWFLTAASGDGVVFRANAGGTRTSNNTRFARSELREMNSLWEGEKLVRYETASWDLADNLERRMFIRQAITAVPLNKPQVTVGQIHNARDDVVMIKFEGDSPGHLSKRGALQVRLNNAKDTYVIDPAYEIGQTFTVEIIAQAGKVSVLYNGKPTIVRDTPIRIETAGCYWKAGMYIQSSTGNRSTYKTPFEDEAPDAYGEVVIHELRLTTSPGLAGVR